MTNSESRFLRRLYVATDGKPSAARAVETIASDVGLDMTEGYRIARHLVYSGHVAWRASGVVSVTPAGAEDVEDVERRRRLNRLIRSCDGASIRADLDRICDALTEDPEAAIDATRALLERALRTYIAAENLAIPAHQSVRGLWRVVQRHLRLVPSPLGDAELGRVLRGLSAVVDGVAAMTAPARDGGTRGLDDPEVDPLYAAVSVRAAYTVVTFLVDTLRARAEE